MKLTLTKMIHSPFGRHFTFIYPLESRGAFLMSDEWTIALLHASGNTEVIWQTTDEEVAYKWRGLYDDRLTNQLFDEIRQSSNGFKVLSKEEYELIDGSGLYDSPRGYTPFLSRGHHGTFLAFSGKSITLLKFEGDHVLEQAKTKMKGKEAIASTLHPKQNLIIYGTNRGELFGQPFGQIGFGRVLKIDLLPNTCYQTSFSPDGSRLIATGLGYVKIYKYNGAAFKLHASITTAARSFVLVGDYLVLNKGMHGLDVLRIKDEPERVISMELPFMINRMYYLAPQRTLLLISGSSNEWALLNWTD